MSRVNLHVSCVDTATQCPHNSTMGQIFRKKLVRQAIREKHMFVRSLLCEVMVYNEKGRANALPFLYKKGGLLVRVLEVNLYLF